MVATNQTFIGPCATTWRSTAAVAWLRRLYDQGASVCSGSVMLAETGRLDEREATTHWAYRASSSPQRRARVRRLGAGTGRSPLPKRADFF